MLGAEVIDPRRQDHRLDSALASCWRTSADGGIPRCLRKRGRTGLLSRGSPHHARPGLGPENSPRLLHNGHLIAQSLAGSVVTAHHLQMIDQSSQDALKLGNALRVRHWSAPGNIVNPLLSTTRPSTLAGK